MNNIKRRYFREIRMLLPCSIKEKKRCIKELTENVDDFMAECPYPTYDALCAALGTPQSIAESFLAQINPVHLSRKMSLKRKIATGVVAIVALLAIMLAVIAILYADELRNYQNGYVVDIVYELPDGVLPSPLEEY